MTLIVTIEPKWGRSFAELGCPDAHILTGDPPLGIYRIPHRVDDCKAMMDPLGIHIGWLHGTDCEVTRSIAANLDNRDPFIVAQCARQAAGGLFEYITIGGGRR